ncbi:cytochrome c/c1 heme-lyase [Exophiala viscosa]|uniref:Holocytochrome c-type synthase n=2 Tax=Exophiala viscosa TaxID=2486360 RepID=A0AAN6E476_9EURO|nr:cytochrome c/c1 heme-lyase [Exophiala viscosa]
MGWWKADPVPDPQPPQLPSTPPHPIPTQSHPASTSESSCPVDPKTRAIWLQQVQKTPQSQSQAQSQLPPSHPPLPTSTPTPTPSRPPVPTAYASSQECSSDRISQSPLPPSDIASLPQSSRPLSQDRVVSSIPRAATPESTLSTPANNESETGTSASGNWIYPSESQFFNAVMRKQTSSNPSDLISSISHIIPIHNAVNERAWTLIRKWEGDSSASCGGPKLQSFKGLGSGAISPKARMKTFMGYTEPFDRHDWVVERCGGETVEYVIDFYQGKQEASGNPNALNFYLDVRPKLNTFEGWKMRAERIAGWR